MKAKSLVLVLSSSLALLVLPGCGRQSDTAPLADIRPVRAEQVGAASSPSGSRYAGEVRARYETDLAFRVGGRISSRRVDAGSRVVAGQVIATLDPQDYALAASAADSQLVAARAEAQLAQQDLQRYTELRARNFIAQAELDRRRMTADAAEARVKALSAEAARQANQRAYTSLNAPYPGVIARIDAEPGQVVATGQTVAQLARTGELEAVVSVPENELDKLGAARKLSIRLWSAPGKIYAGKLRELSPIADAATRTYRARIAFARPDDDVKLGMTATVEAALVAAESLSVAQSALYRVNSQPQVWVVDTTTGQVTPRAVQLGPLAGERVAVVSGLKPGEWVVTAGVHKLAQGQKVKLILPSSPVTPAVQP
jgi:multidrug efflux system membrane fusion protein